MPVSLIPGAVGAATKVTAPMIAAPVAAKIAPAAGPTLGAVESSVIGSSLAALAPELLKTLFGQGGALRSPASAQTTGTAGKFTITAQDVLALEQFVDRINFRRPFGPKLDANEILNDTAKRLNEQLNQATRREMELARVKGELAALPNLMTSIGQIGTAQSQLAQAGLSKVLESALPASYLGNLGASYQITK
tara:strand:- start:136 stop:714 length:579 start_codon:yes stop_codon:yes gene_type:complete